MELAITTAKRSSCASKQVGLVIVNDEDRIIMASYNGVPKGQKHCCEIFDEDDVRKSEAIRNSHHQWSLYNELHSEQNAIAYCSMHGISTKNSIIYITVSPCIHCAKILLVAGVKKVVYLEEYDKDKEGLEFLKKNLVICEKYDGD